VVGSVRGRRATPETVIGGSGGDLAVGGMSEAKVAQLLERLPALFVAAQYERDGQVRRFELPMRNGPRLIVLDSETAWPILGAELLDLTGPLVAFAWQHPVFAPEGAIVMFSETFADLRALTRAGVLDESWWQRLVEHEVGFHLRGQNTVGGLPHGEHAADLIDALPLDLRIKLSLGEAAAMTRAGSTAWLARRWGVSEAEVRAAAAGSSLLAVSRDGLVVAAFPRMRAWARPAPGRAVVARLRSLLAGAPEFTNLDADQLPRERAQAQAAGVVPVRVGTPEAAALLAEGGLFKWSLRPDGSLWIARGSAVDPRGVLVEITHAVLAEGGPVLAAGEIFGVVGHRRAAAIDLLSGHYHRFTDARDNTRALALGRAAFERHGVRIAFDFRFDGDDTIGPRPGGLTKEGRRCSRRSVGWKPPRSSPGRPSWLPTWCTPVCPTGPR
jgi:hypothetical protein